MSATSKIQHPARKQEKRKHIPQRMCVSCRGHSAKRELIRIVRTPECLIEVDLTGRANGRGAYLCEKPGCWLKALDNGLLSKALNTEISDSARDSLNEYIQQLAPPAD